MPRTSRRWPRGSGAASSTVIEFVGPSGAGKTAVARAVLALPGGPTWARRSLAPDPARARMASLVRTVPAVAYLPAIGWRLARRQPTRGVCWRLGRRATTSIVFLAARNRWQRLLPQAHLSDQGLVHGLAHRTRRWPDDERADALVALYSALGRKCAPTLVVHFDVPPSLAAARSKMANPLHHDAHEVAGIVAAIKQSVDAAHTTVGVHTVATDNSSTVAATAEELLPLLASRVAGAHEAPDRRQGT